MHDAKRVVSDTIQRIAKRLTLLACNNILEWKAIKHLYTYHPHFNPIQHLPVLSLYAFVVFFLFSFMYIFFFLSFVCEQISINRHIYPVRTQWQHQLGLFLNIASTNAEFSYSLLLQTFSLISTKASTYSSAKNTLVSAK